MVGAMFDWIFRDFSRIFREFPPCTPASFTIGYMLGVSLKNKRQ